MTPNSWLKGVAEGFQRSKLSLLVLAVSNDPFNVGSPAHLRDAEWLVNIWDKFGLSHNIAIRQIHYKCASHGEITWPGGEVYENTTSNLSRLEATAKYARVLGLLDMDDFEDRRNPDAIINDSDGEPEPPLLSVENPSPWQAPGIYGLMSPRVDLAYPTIYGYHPRSGDQPYLLEVWVEKSTMNSILEPLCRRLGVNLVGAKGFQSLTGVKNLVKRIRDSGRPGHILYISDFDPGGWKMPVAVARSCQFLLEWLRQDVPLTIEPILMTPEQVAKYDLPKVPIKDKDRAKKKFEALHGEGGVELDALEALYPGEFERIVTESILRYRDSTYGARLEEVLKEAESQVAEEWQSATGELEAEIEPLRDQVMDIYKRYREPLNALREELDAELVPINEQLADLYSKYIAEIVGFETELPSRPVSEADGEICTDPLFDGKRGFVEQTELLIEWQTRKSHD
jgi:hypothetical protein